MDIAFGIVIYFVVWWITLFAVLPLWVKPQSDDGDVIPGTATSAPVSPMILKKFALTTVLSAAIFLFFYIMITYQWLSIDSIPFLPRFDGRYE